MTSLRRVVTCWHARCSLKGSMIVESGTWFRLDPEHVCQVPAKPGVLVVANLVRSVHVIDRANGDLRARAFQAMQEFAHLRTTTGGLYARFEIIDDETTALDAALGEFRRLHGGMLPPGNATARQGLRVIRRAA